MADPATPGNNPGITSPGVNMSVDDMYKALSGGANTAMATANPGKNGIPAANSPIFTGYSTARKRESLEGGAPVKGQNKTPMFEPYSQAKLAPLTWTDEQMAKFVNQGVINKVPGFDVNMGMPEIMNQWDKLVTASFGFNSRDPKNPTWTPQDVLNTYANPQGKFGTVKRGDWEYDIATGEKVKYVGPLTKTSTSTNINELTREDALALTKQSMATMLGRMPTNDEVSKYMSILNGYEAAHPQVSTTTANISPETGEQVSSNTVTTGGSTAAGKQALIEEQMQRNPEYGAYQAATTGMNWLMAKINGG